MSPELESDEFPEVERYELHENRSYHFSADRREFVQVVGAGLMIAVTTDASRAQAPGRRGGERGPRREEKLTDRFHIDQDGVVTVLTSKVEAGQGSRTQIAQAAAEELSLPVSQIRVIMADTELCPDDGGTAGSRTTPSTVPRIRNAAAAAREQLAAYAATRLGVDRSKLKIDAGVFSSDSRQVTLKDLASDGQLTTHLAVTPPEGITLKQMDAWKVLGTSVSKVTGREVVTGTAQYPSDIVRKEMLYGKILRPVSFNARLKSLDVSTVQAMAGVSVIRDGDFVGCAAPTSWLATQAIEAIAAKAEWDESQHPSSSELFEVLKKREGATGSGFSRPRENAWGKREAAFAAANKKLDASYKIAYIQHAPMEPRAAVAEWTDGKLTVWTGTQQPSRVQDELRQAFRLPADRVRVIVPDTGGGFGGKHSGEAAVEAARLAKGVGRPVSLRWTREEEFTWAYFRPSGLIEVQAGLDQNGKLAAWDFANYNSGGSAIDSPYRIPNGRTRFLASNAPLRQGSYRALASTANTFARESAMDELAEMAGADPLDFRLNHLEDGRIKDVLVAATEKFQWRQRGSDPSRNRGIGLACGTEKGSFVAACVEVEVTDKRINVLSVCEAYECGAIHNPGNLRAQVVGAIIMGLGGALTERVEFKGGKITNPRFSEYHVPRMDDVPEIEVVLLDRRDLPSVGAGETPIIAVAPAIANATYRAVGIRSRSMPLEV
jgi:CO/xanthine dehydrogenase Mo-binding subunit